MTRIGQVARCRVFLPFSVSFPSAQPLRGGNGRCCVAASGTRGLSNIFSATTTATAATDPDSRVFVAASRVCDGLGLFAGHAGLEAGELVEDVPVKRWVRFDDPDVEVLRREMKFPLVPDAQFGFQFGEVKDHSYFPQPPALIQYANHASSPNVKIERDTARLRMRTYALHAIAPLTELCHKYTDAEFASALEGTGAGS